MVEVCVLRVTDHDHHAARSSRWLIAGIEQTPRLMRSWSRAASATFKALWQKPAIGPSDRPLSAVALRRNYGCSDQDKGEPEADKTEARASTAVPSDQAKGLEICLKSIGDIMSEWISVEDRLPEVGQYCLLSRRIRGDYWWFGCAEYQSFGFPFVMMDDPNPVTHWMPLPPPPEET